MSRVFIEEATLTGIADAIREKEGSEEKIPTTEMAGRIGALGGAVEYTTGTATFDRSYSARTIAHGLTKKPKLFYLYWENVKTTNTVYLSFVAANERIGNVLYGGGANGLSNAYTTHVGVSDPSYGAVSVDETNVYITATARQWEAGTWYWEAWTW